MVDKMFYVLSKVNKIKIGIIPVPLLIHKIHSPKNFLSSIASTLMRSYDY